MIDQIEQFFDEHRDEEIAGPMAKYMRDQFPFLGLKAPQRRVLQKQFWQEYGWPKKEALHETVRFLWHLPEREYQLMALDLLSHQWRDWSEQTIDLFEELLLTKSWWDTVDALSSPIIDKYFVQFPQLKEERIAKWRIADNIWLRRVAIIFQRKYKQKTDVDLLFAVILENAGSAEFFIQKGIGWALREYSKTDATAVRDFVATHQLAPLSKREALKWLNR